MDIKTIAIIDAYNEEDIIEPLIDHYLYEGLDSIYVLDNESTDSTASRVKAKKRKFSDRIFYSSFSTNQTWNPRINTQVKNALCEKIQAASKLTTWVIFSEADEFIEPLACNTKVCDEIYKLEEQGFNSAYCVMLNYFPMQNEAEHIIGENPRLYYKNFRIDKYQKRFILAKQPIFRLGAGFSPGPGNHRVNNSNKAIASLTPFLLHHFPFRGTDRTRKKLDRDRRSRLAKSVKRAGGANYYFKDPQYIEYSPLHNNQRKDLNSWTSRKEAKKLISLTGITLNLPID